MKMIHPQPTSDASVKASTLVRIVGGLTNRTRAAEADIQFLHNCRFDGQMEVALLANVAAVAPAFADASRRMNLTIY